MKLLISISLIATYSIVLLHSVLPHYHVVEDVTSIESHEDTYHDHDHGHHHVHQHSSTVFDALIDFLGHLGHHDIGEDHLDNYVANTVTKTDLEKKSEIIECIIPQSYIEYSLFEKSCLLVFEGPPILYEHFSCSPATLRGPPLKS